MVEPKKKKQKTLSSLFSPKKNPLDLVAAIYPKGVPSIVPGTGERNKKNLTPKKQQMLKVTTRSKYMKDISIPFRLPKKPERLFSNPAGRFFSSVASSQASKFFARRKKGD